MSELRPFHLAVPVRDIAESRTFYGEVMGFSEGRSSEDWIDWNMYGHQLVTHLNPNLGAEGKVPLHYNGVDGKGVPVPHFGVVLTQADWQALADRLQGQVTFVIEPYTRFKGETGEQSTLFFLDPSGNALEFKAFADLGQLFAK
ncbi:VOC family protein [Leucothrix mucor]|uniref:VOC family protein n=1 Tax=Leucothrix mucor TaxID=45248 RepID=UPI0003B4C134|nr:VOC family protein [Leucothrix mucor]